MRDTIKPTFVIIRAIGSEFARRILRPLTLIGVGVALALVGIGGWLTTISPWWWLLEVPFLFAALVFTVLAVVAWTIVRLARPQQSKDQTVAVRAYVDKLQRVAENLQTPQLVILFYVVRDIFRPRPDSFIETVSHDSKTLAPDFAALIRKFS